MLTYVNVCSSYLVTFLNISLFNASIDIRSFVDAIILFFNLHSYGAFEFKFLLIYKLKWILLIYYYIL